MPARIVSTTRVALQTQYLIALTSKTRHKRFFEVFGGIALIVGLLVTVVSLPLIVSMIVAIFTVQGHYGFSSVNTIGLTASGPVVGPPGYEINLLYIVGLLTLALSRPSAFSVDQFLSRGKTVGVD